MTTLPAGFAARAARPVAYVRDPGHPDAKAAPTATPQAGQYFTVPPAGQLARILRSAGLPPHDAQIVARINGLASANRIEAGSKLYIPTAAEIASARDDILRHEDLRATRVPSLSVPGPLDGLRPGTGGVGARTFRPASPAPALARPAVGDTAAVPGPAVAAPPAVGVADVVPGPGVAAPLVSGIADVVPGPGVAAPLVSGIAGVSLPVAAPIVAPQGPRLAAAPPIDQALDEEITDEPLAGGWQLIEEAGRPPAAVDIGKLEEAVALLETIPSESEEYPESLVAHGVALHRWAEALRLESPDDPEARQLEVMARASLQKATELEPTADAAAYNLAVSCAALGELPAARRHLESAIALASKRLADASGAAGIADASENLADLLRLLVPDDRRESPTFAAIRAFAQETWDEQRFDANLTPIMALLGEAAWNELIGRVAAEVQQGIGRAAAPSPATPEAPVTSARPSVEPPAPSVAATPPRAAAARAAGPSPVPPPPSPTPEQRLVDQLAENAQRMEAPENQLPELKVGQAIVVGVEGNRAVEFRIEAVDARGVTLRDVYRRIPGQTQPPMNLTFAELAKKLHDEKTGWQVHAAPDLSSPRVPFKAEQILTENLRLQEQLMDLQTRQDLGEVKYAQRVLLLARRAEIGAELGTQVAALRAWQASRDARPSRWLLRVPTEAFGEAPQRGPIARLQAAQTAIEAAIERLDSGETLSPDNVGSADPVLTMVGLAAAGGASSLSTAEELRVRLGFLNDAAAQGRVEEGWVAYHATVRPYLTLQGQGGESFHRLANGKPSLTAAIHRSIDLRAFGEGRLALSANEVEAMRSQVAAHWPAVVQSQGMLLAGGTISAVGFKPAFDARAFDAEVARLRALEAGAAHVALRRQLDFSGINAAGVKLHATEHALGKRVSDGVAELIGIVDDNQFIAMSVVSAGTGSAATAIMGRLGPLIANGTLRPAVASALVRGTSFGLQAAGLTAGMNAYHQIFGNKENIDWSPTAFALNGVRMALGGYLAAGHAKRLDALSVVTGRSAALMRRAGEAGRYMVAQDVSFTGLALVETLVRDGKLDNAWQVVEQNFQFMLASRLTHTVSRTSKAAFTKLQTARAAYLDRPTPEQLRQVMEALEETTKAVNKLNRTQQAVAQTLRPGASRSTAATPSPRAGANRAPAARGPGTPAAAPAAKARPNAARSTRAGGAAAPSTARVGRTAAGAKPTPGVHRPRRAPTPRPQRRNLSAAKAREVTNARQEVRLLLSVPSNEPLAKRLQGIGYHEVGRSGAGRIMKRGASYVTVTEVTMGNRPATVIDIRGTGRIRPGLNGYRFAHFEGTVIPWKHWSSMVGEYETVMRRFLANAGATGDPFKPRDLATLRAFTDEGRTPAQKARRAARKQEMQTRLDELTTTLKRMIAEGRAPKSIVIYMDGPDAAGKSSTGAAVLEAIGAAGYDPRLVSFKGPTAAERAAGPEKRFEQAIPTQGQVVGMDRGPGGDPVYSGASAPQVLAMAQSFQGLRAQMEAQGAMFIPILVYANRAKQSRTLGKRLARADIARQLAAGLSADGRLAPADRDALHAITQRVGTPDFVAFANYGTVLRRFLDFAHLTGGWTIADASSRHPARVGIIDSVMRRLRNPEVPIYLSLPGGVTVDSVVAQLVQKANDTGRPHAADFNGLELLARPGDSAATVKAPFDAKMTRRRQVEAAQAVEEAHRRAERLAALEGPPVDRPPPGMRFAADANLATGSLNRGPPLQLITPAQLAELQQLHLTQGRATVLYEVSGAQRIVGVDTFMARDYETRGGFLAFGFRGE